MELLTNPAFLALLGTIFGGVGLKIVENLLQKSKTQTDLAAQIRTELRTDVTALRAEIRRVELEVDQWRDKYYQLLEQFIAINLRLTECENTHQAIINKEEDTPKKRVSRPKNT